MDSPKAPRVLRILGYSVAFSSGQCSVCLHSTTLFTSPNDQSLETSPELRLPPVAVASAVRPVGLFALGWTLQNHNPWITPIISTGLIAFSMRVTLAAISSYLIDAYGVYGVSAISSTKIIRGLSDAFFPLIAPPLLDDLGFGWGFSTLGFIALATIPVPLLGIKWGKRLRSVGEHRIIQ